MVKTLGDEDRFDIVFGLIAHVVETLKSSLRDNLVSVVLYGSYARGQIKPESDVDIMIVARGLSRSSLERQGFIAKILRDVEAPIKERLRETGWFPYISAILKTPEEADHISRIYFDMIDEAKILFDRGDFFKSVLEKTRKRLNELGARKIHVGKMWYWDLKPDYQPGEIFEI